MTKAQAIILAGGQGVRMRSRRPKTLQELGGQPMIRYIVASANDAGFERIHIVHGEDGDEVKALVSADNINWVYQSAPLGTGHAVLQAIPHLEPHCIACVLYGDIPLVESATMTRLVQLADTHTLSLLTVELEDPTGYGRIKRSNDGGVIKIVEEKDASTAERNITEVNAGPIAAKYDSLRRWLNRLDNDNSQNEYYLTDIISHAVAEGVAVASCQTLSRHETAGVNSRIEQAQLERIVQLKQAEKLMRSGVQIIDPARFDLRGRCSAGKDCRIDVNVVLEGEVSFADNVQIDANNVIRNSTVGTGVTIRENCSIEGATIGDNCTIGPYARIRPGTVIGKNSRIGNFVEIKASTIGEGSKINHLAYVGDAHIGSNVNIGAGVITCNYDGKKKHPTIIGDNVFVGSNSSLIAPLEIHDDARIGAGSTISKNVNSGELVVERAQLRTFKRKAAQRNHKDSTQEQSDQ